MSENQHPADEGKAPVAEGNPGGDKTVGSGTNEEQEILTCMLNNVEFGLNISTVQEIVRLPKITPVPGAPSYVDGVGNLRGNVLPVINSHERFGMPKMNQDTENNRVIVVELSGVPTGLVVDAVKEVMRVHVSEIEPAPAVVQGVASDFLKGIVKLNHGSRLVLLLDPNMILDKKDFANLTNATKGVKNEQKVVTDKKGAEDDQEQLVTFRIGEEEYAISIMNVQETIRVPSITVIPNAPDGIEGTTSLRNRVLPVMDLRKVMGFASLKQETSDFLKMMESYEGIYAGWGRTTEENLQQGKAIAEFNEQAALNFGRWLKGYQTKDKVTALLLRPFADAYKDISSLIKGSYEEMRKAKPEQAQHIFQSRVWPELKKFIDLFAKLYKGISEREDERCLVVDIKGARLGLRIDAVSQVLKIQRDLIEQMPELATAGAKREQVKSVAKLDDGQRLIMYLDPEKLISPDQLARLCKDSGNSDTNRSAAATGKGDGVDTDERQLVSFRVADEEFATDIQRVQEIVRLEKVTKVPHVPRFVEGMVNLRGNVLPVISLRKRFDLEDDTYTDATRVVVVDVKGMRVGIIVDRVSEVMRISMKHIEPAPSIVNSKYGDEYIEGVGKIENGERMVLLLNTEKILNSNYLAQLSDQTGKPAGEDNVRRIHTERKAS